MNVARGFEPRNVCAGHFVKSLIVNLMSFPHLGQITMIFKISPPARALCVCIYIERD